MHISYLIDIYCRSLRRWEKETTQMACLQGARHDGTAMQLAVGKSSDGDLTHSIMISDV